MYISNKLEVRKTEKGKSLFARLNLEKDEILIRFEGEIIDKPTKTTLQIEENRHLEGPGELDDFLNHSCEPNGYINFKDLTFRALHNIKKEEEITFNYLTTEWDMANKFECYCGAEKCFRQIKGFKYLTLEQKKSLEHLLSPFLKKKLRESDSKLNYSQT